LKRSQRSSHRLRNRDLGGDFTRPAHRQGVRQRARQRGGARGNPGRAALLARRAPEPDRRRDADEANPDPELPLRRDDRAGGADLPPPRGGRAADAESGGGMTDTVDLASSSREEVAAELLAGDRFLLTAHEGPDGDALGSLLGMHKVLTQLGKDSIMFMAAKEFPLPI